MSEYGVKIKNIEAATLYEYNLGVRQRYLSTQAMMTNSLLLKFLKQNGLRVSRNGASKDVICLTFNMGAKSKDEHIKNLTAALERTNDASKKEYLQNSIQRLEELELDFAGETKEDIRRKYYNNGVDIPYYILNKDTDEYQVDEVVHYKMFYRSTGKAKQGSCMFINEKLYDKAIDFIRMGIKLPEENAPIVEMSAYSSLIGSTMVGEVIIPPEDILILKDVKSDYTTKVISIETNNMNHCIAKMIENYTNSYDMFDGQALIDSSIFPKWGNGYILLRQHFCKMASFNTDIQGFFRDYFGDRYETATVTDMFGNAHLAKDIKLITTNNAIKWAKFGISYEYWCQKVHECGNSFGIVKTAHESKLGDFQRMSYQMINSLDINIMPQVMRKSVNYIKKLKTDDAVYMDYLKRTSNFANDHEVMIALYKQNPKIIQSDYFKSRRNNIVDTYLRDVKGGHIIQNGDNLTLVGSPYAMLLHAVGEDIEKDTMFSHEDDTIQCYTERFNDGEYLAGFRSPYNSKSNCCYLHNVINKDVTKYFHFGKLIMAVNTLHTDYEDRGNGLDFDSDSQYVTNQPEIVECARKYYLNNPTIVNNIPKSANKYSSSMDDFARVDNNLARSQRGIGESTNIAQIAQSYGYTYDDKDYEMYNALLATICQCCIDNAKRTFSIDIPSEIRRIKQELEIKEKGLPIFWKVIKRDGVDYTDKINEEIKCPMNKLFNLNIPRRNNNTKTIPLKEFFKNIPRTGDYNTNIKVEEIIREFELEGAEFMFSDEEDTTENYLLLRSDFDDLIKALEKVKLSKNYLSLCSWLINRAFGLSPKTKNLYAEIFRNRQVLLKTLYTSSPNNVLEIFSKEPVEE